MCTNHCTVSCSLIVAGFGTNAVIRKSFKDKKGDDEASVWISYWKSSSWKELWKCLVEKLQSS